MLPLSHSQPYQQFKHQVETLQTAIAQQSLNASVLKDTVAQLQQHFQTQILTLNLNELESTMAHHVQAFNVEIDKQLRLLAMDCLFLQAAKQPSTAEGRRHQAGDRLILLTRYCNALLGEEPDEP